MKEILEKRIEEIEKIADDMGIDYYPLNYEIVPQETMLEVISYGLPTRARHWSYGQSYDYQKMQGEMGFSKIYEVVLNNDPSYAFLLDTNSDIANTMVSAHVVGHSCFFKTNFLFKKTDNKMVYHAAERARRIEDYIQKYGLKAVEKIMDIGFALEKHIDWHKGLERNPKKKKEKTFVRTKIDEFDDLLGEEELFYKLMFVKEPLFPSSPEYDLIWFLINYSKSLEPWQMDVLEIIRQESYYFYPQYMTKIMNEGFASFVHAEIMLKLGCLHDHEYLDFCKIHEKVVQPGANKLSINPYFLGFSIFTEIRETWDEKYKNGESEINGLQKIFQIVEKEDDISFIRNYLTEDLAKELKLFSYENIKTSNGDQAVHIIGTELDQVKEAIIKDLYNYRSPLICVTSVEDGILQLKHMSANIGTLDEKHIKVVMKYIYKLWENPINLEALDSDGSTIHYTFDEAGFSD
jgi:stage V sporulation protein R